MLRPNCAVCKKPVDLFWWIRNPGSEDLTYVAKCHGRSEQVIITYSDQLYMIDKQITLTEAFKNESPRLPEQAAG